MVRGGMAGLATILLVSVATGALAQAPSEKPAPFPSPFQSLFEGTPEEQAACRPDSSKFCRDAEPDTFRVLACLQRNRTKISVACRRVLESHGQ
jgi:hypothetical protein